MGMRAVGRKQPLSLLAFAIDAWWQRRAELEQANALVVSLFADFQASQAHLEIWLVGNRRSVAQQRSYWTISAAQSAAEKYRCHSI